MLDTPPDKDYTESVEKHRDKQTTELKASHQKYTVQVDHQYFIHAYYQLSPSK